MVAAVQELPHLPQLARASLQSNRIEEWNPELFGNCPKLRELYLSHNNLPSPPSEIGQLVISLFLVFPLVLLYACCLVVPLITLQRLCTRLSFLGLAPVHSWACHRRLSVERHDLVVEIGWVGCRWS